MKYVSLLGVVLILACTKEVAVDIPQQEILPVVNGIFKPDSLITIELGKTRGILDNVRSGIDDAQIILLENGAQIDTLKFTDGVYESKTTPNTNQTYALEINIPNFETVYAKDKIPTPPSFESIVFENNTAVDEEGEPLSNLQLIIRDDGSTEDYYELLLKTYSATLELETGSTLFSFNPAFARKNDIVLENENILELFDFVNPVFSDELFNGTNYVMNVKYYNGVIDVFDANDQLITTITNLDLVIELRHVSKDYYTYKKRLLQHLESQFNDIWDGVGEPAPMFTNIQNGLGIFAGYNTARDTLYAQD